MPITYDTQTDWGAFTGSKRVYGGVLRLAYVNTASQLQLSGLRVNYRFGQSQGFQSDGSTTLAATTTAKNGGAVALGQDGARAVGDAGLRPGGAPEDYTVYQMPASPAPGTIQNTVVSFWTNPKDQWEGTVWGWSQDYLAGTDATWTAMKVAYRVTLSGYSLGVYAYGSDLGDYAGWPNPTRRGRIDASLPLPEWATDGRQHHFLLFTFWYRDPARDNNAYARTRVFIDGRFVGDLIDTTSDSFGAQTDFLIGPHGGPKPLILAMGTAEHDYSSSPPAGPYEAWGPQDIALPWGAAVDEFCLARCPVAQVNAATPVEPPWASGARVLSVTRHPDVGALGYNSSTFVLVGPVVNTGRVDAAVNRVVPTLTDARPAPAGTDDGLPYSRVLFSTRASPSPFAAADTTLPWSNWYELHSGVHAEVASRGVGQYVQSRLKLLPSDDEIRSSCPGVDRLELYLAQDDAREPVQDGTATLGGSLQVKPYKNLSARIPVTQNGAADLPASFYLYLKGQTTVGATIWVSPTVTQGATAYVKHTVEQPARIPVFALEGVENVGATIPVDRHEVFLPGVIQVSSGLQVTVDASILVRQPFLGGRITVTRPGVRYLGATIVVPVEKPAKVTGLAGDIPEKAWQSATALHMAWLPATFRSIPVVGYYYNFSQVANRVPGTDWTFTASNAADVTIDAAGRWYFSVAAYNEAGVLGDAAVWEVWFNHAPTAPGGLTINGLDTLGAAPLVACRPSIPHALGWTVATDPDAGDAAALRYHVQIATQSHFGNDPATGQPTLVEEHQNIGGTTLDWAESPKFGTLFWRIRASDGKQSSDWSDVGSFVVNTPPLKVTQLTARQT